MVQGEEVMDKTKTDCHFNMNPSVFFVFTFIVTTSAVPAGHSSQLKSIADTAAAEQSLSTLFAAVKAAGLAETLSGEGDFTVFAPTNDAFDKVKTLPLLLQPMNKDLLSKILLRHVLPTSIMAGEIPRK